MTTTTMSPEERLNERQAAVYHHTLSAIADLVRCVHEVFNDDPPVPYRRAMYQGAEGIQGALKDITAECEKLVSSMQAGK